jgi:hypothetical protein
MARANSPSSAMRLGAGLAISGTGIIAASPANVKDFRPVLIDPEIYLLGRLGAVGTVVYPFIDAEVLAGGEATPDTEPEACTGITALLLDMELRRMDSGEMIESDLSRCVVPFAVDELQFHRAEDGMRHA